MRMTLLFKELRECRLYAGLALIAILHCIGSGMDLPLIPFLSSPRGQEIPFLTAFNGSGREVMFTSIAIIAAVVLGLHQSLWESWRQTTLFLLHLPMSRTEIFLHKLFAGTVIILSITSVPLLVYSVWAATPGTHASPFFWGMTDPWWRSIAIAVVCYLGAFQTGLRPGHWLGSRTWPFVAALTLSLLMKYVPVWMSINYLGFAALIVCFTITILETARTREFP